MECKFAQIISQIVKLFSSILEILFLQIEPCDDQSGNNASDVLNNSSDSNTGSHLPAVKEVINFM